MISDFKINLFATVCFLLACYSEFTIFSTVAAIILVAMIGFFSIGSLCLILSLKARSVFDVIKDSLKKNENFVKATKFDVVFNRALHFGSCLMAGIFALNCGFQIIGVCYIASSAVLNALASFLDDRLRATRK